MAHQARWGLLLARTDPDVPKHAGLTYFACDMTVDGVEVRPLRQLTGEAEFNEVFLTGAVIGDGDRIGGVGEGWRVAQGTLMNERVSIGGTALPREGGMIGSAARAWREHPEQRTPGLHDRMLRLWAAAEVARLASERLRQQLAVGHPGPEGSAAKLVFARLNQEITALEVEMAGADGLRYEDWSMRRPESVSFYGRDPGYRYLRARGNSIEGGTSEILRNIIAERVLGLPSEPRTDTRCPGRTCPGEHRPVPEASEQHWRSPAAHDDAAHGDAAGQPDRGLPGLLYGEAEEQLRAAVRDLLQERAGWSAVLARTETSEPYDTGAVADAGRRSRLRRPAHPGEPRRRRGQLPRGRGRRGGGRPGGGPRPVPGQRGGRDGRRAVGRRCGAAVRAGRGHRDRGAGRPVRQQARCRQPSAGQPSRRAGQTGTGPALTVRVAPPQPGDPRARPG